MAYTEFYCDPGGSNLNGGSSASTTAALSQTNSNWDGSSTYIFPALTDISAAAVGAFASVYVDGATVGVYVARITAVTGSGGATPTITLSTTAKSGTPPTVSVTGRSIKVGGAWKGPNAAENFPFNFITNTLTNTSTDAPRVNLKAGTYSITAVVTHSTLGLVRFEGYTSAVGDGGRFTLDGSTNAIILLTLSGSGNQVVNGIFSNNGASGTNEGVNLSGNYNRIEGCVAHDIRGYGIHLSATQNQAVECEAYTCNTANSSGQAGIKVGDGCMAIRCISHDNVGSNNSGFRMGTGSAASTAICCIADTNGQYGFQFIDSEGPYTLINCEAYNNVSDGVRFNSSAGFAYAVNFENCNFLKNGGYGINGVTSRVSNGGYIRNCGFGVGTQANTSGDTNAISSINVVGSVSYATGVTPWTDPANGDFRISLAAAINAGRGSFTQTAASYAGTIGYPDIGAGQHLEGGMLRNFNPSLSGAAQ